MSYCRHFFVVVVSFNSPAVCHVVFIVLSCEYGWMCAFVSERSVCAFIHCNVQINSAVSDEHLVFWIYDAQSALNDFLHHPLTHENYYYKFYDFLVLLGERDFSCFTLLFIWQRTNFSHNIAINFSKNRAKLWNNSEKKMNRVQRTQIKVNSRKSSKTARREKKMNFYCRKLNVKIHEMGT